MPNRKKRRHGQTREDTKDQGRTEPQSAANYNRNTRKSGSPQLESVDLERVKFIIWGLLSLTVLAVIGGLFVLEFYGHGPIMDQVAPIAQQIYPFLIVIGVAKAITTRLLEVGLNRKDAIFTYRVVWARIILSILLLSLFLYLILYILGVPQQLTVIIKTYVPTLRDEAIATLSKVGTWLYANLGAIVLGLLTNLLYDLLKKLKRK